MYRLKNILPVQPTLLVLILFVLVMPAMAFGEEREMPIDSATWLTLINSDQKTMPEKVVDVSELITLALINSVELRALYADWQRQEEHANGVVIIPDPSISLGYFIEPIETAQGAQTAKISVGHTIPWLSKSKASHKMRISQAAQAFEVLDNARLNLQRDIRRIWAEAQYLQSTQLILQEQVQLVKDLEEILIVQYQSASLSHQRLVDIQIQSLFLAEKLAETKSREHRLRIRLSSILNMGNTISESFLHTTATSAGFDEPDTKLPSDHPRLNRLDHLSDFSRAHLSGARANYMPDLRIGLDYILTDKRVVDGVEIEDSGKNPFVISAGLALPIWNWKQKKSEVKASIWQKKQVQNLRIEEGNALKEEYDIAWLTLTDDLRKIRLYEDELIPRTLEIEKVVEQDYISQSSDISVLTSTKIKRLDLQLALAASRFSAATQSALLTYLRGQ